MRARQALCPACGMILEVPPGTSDCFVRCGQCRHRFRLPKRIAVTDEAITEWLSEQHEAEEKHATEAQEKVQEMDQAAISGRTAVLPAIKDPLRLIKADRSGALFEFPASRLREPAFRAAFPRRCVRCGTESRLSVHVVAFATHLLESPIAKGEQAADSDLRGEEIATLSNEELLSRLPKLSDAAPPTDLPMPYWLCDICVNAGIVAGQARLRSDGSGMCRLWIGNLRRAEEFLIGAGGKGSEAHQQITKRLSAMVENPWGSLPTVVQHRVEQWFRPKSGEQFLAYVPDSDHARSEEGMAGVVISNCRVVCHTRARHLEASHAEKLEVEEFVEGNRCALRIKSSAWQIKRMPVERNQINSFRQALSQARFETIWH